MDVNEHERLSKFTLRHKLKLKNNAFIDFSYIINKIFYERVTLIFKAI